jgi:histidyl-tRNA synthetase
VAGLDLYIAPLGEGAVRQAAALARDLRARGKSVELGIDSKLRRSMELANKLGARFTAILGDSELAAGNYQLKAMATGEQQTVTREELFERLGLKVEHAG